MVGFLVFKFLYKGQYPQQYPHGGWRGIRFVGRLGSETVRGSF